LRDLQTGKLSTDDIDARALTVLELVAWSKTQGNTFNYEETESDAQATRPLLQAAAAAAVVILKNDNKVLPIKTARKIAVIGPNARSAVVSGGGSASLLSSYQISPLEGISHAAQEIGAEVEYALGTLAYKAVPLASSFLRLPEDHSTQGMIVEFWKNQPAGFTTTAAIDIPTKPDYWTTYNSASAFMVDNMPADILKSFPYIRVSQCRDTRIDK
jgi:beta-glucosidase